MTQYDQKLTSQTPKPTTVSFSEKELQNSVVEIKFLATSWLDDFEKVTFNGKTVKQIVHPGRYE